jgi:hypothetical protein
MYIPDVSLGHAIDGISLDLPVCHISRRTLLCLGDIHVSLESLALAFAESAAALAETKAQLLRPALRR